MVPPVRIWLIGSMGAGKTSVGLELADMIGWDLLDNDALLTKMTGSSLTDLAVSGEEHLHDSESAQLRAVAQRPPPFVAGVGASVADRLTDLELLDSTGVVVYLRAQPEALARRLGTGQGRPWVQQHPLEWITASFARRDDAYSGAADIVIDVDAMTSYETAGHLMDKLPAAAAAWVIQHPSASSSDISDRMKAW